MRSLNRSLSTLVGLLLISLLSTGCLDTNFDPPQTVIGPRLLAIVAEPPEIALGQDVVFDALVVDETGASLLEDSSITLRYTVCISLASVASAAGLGAGSGLSDNCNAGGDDLVVLERGELPASAARLPGSALLSLATDLQSGMDMGMDPTGGELDPMLAQTLALVLSEVGIPLRVQLEVMRDGQPIITGFKRFAINQRVSPTTNPPAPRFSIGGAWQSARAEGASPRQCAPEDLDITEVMAGAELELSPSIDPELDNEAWLETYPVINLSGELSTNIESSYYSWFSTAGTFSDAITQRPLRITTWTAPDEAGPAHLWLVVRDGHLGASFCHTQVEVLEAEAESAE